MYSSLSCWGDILFCHLQCIPGTDEDKLVQIIEISSILYTIYKPMVESAIIGLNLMFAALNPSSPGRICPICSADLTNMLRRSYLLNHPRSW